MAGSFSSGASAGAAVRNSRDTRRMLKQQRDEELAKMGYSFDENGNMSTRPDSAAEVEQLQAKESAQLAKALQSKLSAQMSDSALEDFAYTGDASYLQKALDQEPTLKQAWAERGVHMVGNIDFDNDRDLLTRMGLKETHYDTPEKKDVLKRNAYKVYNGKDWGIGLLNNVAAETGALTRMGRRRAEPIVENHRNLLNMLSGPKGSPYTVEGHKYEKEITQAAEATGVPANLIASMMHRESSNNPNAVSPKGAAGLMQLMPDTAAELGVTDVNDPVQNINAGAQYFAKMLDKYQGDVRLALAAYNAGPGNVDKYGGIPPFGETQRYVENVLGGLDQGEKYYKNTADNVINTILEHRRGIANADSGTTNANVDKEIQQTDRQLGLKSKELSIELLKNNTKLLTEGATTKQKDLDAAMTQTNQLFEKFGGEEKFYQTDFSDPKNKRDAYPLMNAIEQLEGTELTEADKKNITDIRQLLSIAGPTVKLSDADTGLIDKNLKDLKQYFSDNIKGAEASSAYSAFRNSVRNALFGSALTEHEIKAFDQAYGSLGKKLGPTLQMFETSLTQLEAKLDSIADNMNPISAKVRLGADQEKLLAVREALKSRINYIQGLQDGSIKPGEYKPAEKTLINSERPSLDSIFGE